jgi:hypothetical protein
MIALPGILAVHFAVEMLNWAETRQQGLQAAALFFQRSSAWDLEVYGQQANIHISTVFQYNTGMNERRDRNLQIWALIIGFLLLIGLIGLGVILLVQEAVNSAQDTIRPVSDLTSNIGTQVALVLTTDGPAGPGNNCPQCAYAFAVGDDPVFYRKSDHGGEWARNFWVFIRR